MPVRENKLRETRDTNNNVTNRVPTNKMPTDKVPSNQVPTNQVPTNEISQNTKKEIKPRSVTEPSPVKMHYQSKPSPSTPKKQTKVNQAQNQAQKENNFPQTSAGYFSQEKNEKLKTPTTPKTNRQLNFDGSPKKVVNFSARHFAARQKFENSSVENSPEVRVVKRGNNKLRRSSSVSKVQTRKTGFDLF